MSKNFDKFISAGKYIGTATLGIMGNTAILNYFGDSTLGISTIAALSGGAIGAATGYIAGSAVGGTIGLMFKNKNEIKTEKFIIAGIACVSTALLASNNITNNLSFLGCLYSFSKIHEVSAFLIEKTVEKTEKAIEGTVNFTFDKTNSMINKIRSQSISNLVENDTNKIILR